MKANNSFKALFMLQLQDKLNIKRNDFSVNTLFKIIYTIIQFIVVLLAAYFIFLICQIYHIFAMNSFLPSRLIVLLYSLFFFVNLFVSTNDLIHSLYTSYDNKILLCFPVQPQFVFLSKLAVFYIKELITTFKIILPVFLAYLIVNHVGVGFYFTTIFGMFFLVLFQVAISGILSIPIYIIIKYFKKIYIFQLLFTIVVLFGLMALILIIANRIPKDYAFALIKNWGQYSQILRDFLSDFSKLVFPITILVELLIGHLDTSQAVMVSGFYWKFALIFGSLIILNLIAFLIERKSFFVLASVNDFADAPRVKSINENTPTGSFFTSASITSILYLRTPTTFFNDFAFAIFLPFILVVINKIYGTIDTRTYGDQLIVAFNIFFILLIITSNNVPYASLFSKQGNYASQFKTEPVNFFGYLFGKLLFPLIVNTISILVSIFIIKVPFLSALGYFFIITFLSVSHLLFCLELDLANPQYMSYENGKHKSIDPNKAIAYLLSIVISVGACGYFAFLFSENEGNVITKALCIVIPILIYRIYMFKKKMIVYYRSY